MPSPIFTVQQIQKLDRIAIEKLGIPSCVLMEQAGRAVANEAWTAVKKQKNAAVSVVCGVGNNAGDGFVAARYLRNEGVPTKVFLVGDKNSLKPDAQRNYQILNKLKCSVHILRGVDTIFVRSLRVSSLIVDAMFGVGLTRAILDPYKSIIQTINAQHRHVVAVDIPSGLDGTTGKIYGRCVKASVTVTFSYTKKGFYINDGPRYVGRVVVADIGIPRNLLKKIL